MDELAKHKNQVDTENKGKRAVIFGLLASGAALIYSLYWFSVCDTRTFLVMALVGSLVIGVIAYCHVKGLFARRERRVCVFASILSLSCIVFVFAFPPMTVPDEAHHFFASYWLADVIAGQASLNDSEFPVRDEDFDLYQKSDTIISADSYTHIFNHFKWGETSTGNTVVREFDFSFGSENVITKVGTVIAILLGRALRLGVYPLFYLGRLFNCILFIVGAVAAYRITPVGKNVIAACSLLPMTLHLAASYSYDAGIIALSFVSIALLFRSICRKDQISWQECAQIAACAFLLAPCKVIYVLVFFLVFLIPRDRFASKRQTIMFRIGVFLLMLVSLLLVRLPSIGVIAIEGNGLDYRGEESGHFYSIVSLLLNPVATATMFFRTFATLGDFYWTTVLGGSLGWFQENIKAPYSVMVVYVGLIIIASLQSQDDSIRFSAAQRILFAAIAIIAFLGAMFTMAIGWTFDTENIVMGVQGRYLLPVLPLLLCSIRPKTLAFQGSPFSVCISAISMVNVVYLIRIVAIALSSTV